MEPPSVPRKKTSPGNLLAELHALNLKVPEDISLPSIRQQPPRVQGYAFRFFLVLPLYSGDGKRVFAGEQLQHIHSLFNVRFGGCLAAASVSGAPFFGEYLPVSNLEGIKPV